MDTKQLLTFVTLCELENFTKTAEKLNYAQSSISAQIKQLEKELQTPLFERLGKNVLLTPAGTEFRIYAQKILSLSRDASAAITSRKQQLVIGAAESLVITALPHIITQYKKAVPDVDIRLKLLNCADYVPMLLDNSIDIAFTIGSPIMHNRLHSIHQTKESVSIFCNQIHPLAHKNKVSASDLAEFSFVLTSPGCCYRHSFLTAMEEQHIVVNLAMDSGSIQAIKEATICGLGLCVLPDISVASELQSGLLTRVNYDWNDTIVSQVLYHKDKYLSPTLKGLIDIIQKPPIS